MLATVFLVSDAVALVVFAARLETKPKHATSQKATPWRFCQALALVSGPGKSHGQKSRGELTDPEQPLQNSPRVRQKNPNRAKDVSRINCVRVSFITR